MAAYIGRRLLALVPMLVLVTLIVFLLSQLIPGDPGREILGNNATAAQVQAADHKLGVDRNPIVQYFDWVSHAARGDLGTSWRRQTERVSDQISQRLPITANIAVGALFVTILIGLPLGLLAGTRPQSIADRLVTFGTSAAISIPDFWLAMVLIVLFAVTLQWLPAIGYVDPTVNLWQWFRHIVLLWFAVGIPGAASFARQLRGAVIDAMEQDYIRTARAKGLRRKVIILKHALKNAAMVPVTVLGLQFAYTLGGTVVLERIFAVSGLGQYFLNGLNTGDVPVIQGVTVVVAVTFIVVNLVVDVGYAFLNPRVRLA